MATPNTAEASPPEAAVGPLESLSQMQDAHRNLLRGRHAAAIDAAKHIREIDDFLQLGVVLGQLLDRSEDRDAAQSMLDYWASARDTLVARINTPTLANEGKEAMPRSAAVQNTILQPFKRELIDAAVLSGERVLANLGSDDSRLALRILMRLVRLDGPTRTFSAAPATLTAVRSLGEAGQVDRIVAQLKQAGLIQQALDDQGAPALRLAFDSLMRQWKPLADALAQRLRFRRAAEFWDSHQRDREALFAAGPLLEEALAYRDLGELEREFAEASRARRDHSRNLQRTLLSVAVAVLSVGCAVLLYQQTELNTRNSALRKQSDTLQAQSEQLKKQVELLEQSNKLVGQKEAEAQRQKEISEDRLKSIDDLINEILQSKIAAEDPKIREIGKKYQAKYRALIAAMPKPPAQESLGPGSRIGPPGGDILGTAGVFVQDDKGKRFLLAPRYLLPGKSGDQVCEYNWGSGDFKTGKQIGKIHLFSSIDQYSPTSVAFAELLEGVAASNKLPGNRRITSLATNVKPGMKVQMIGATSGLKDGVVKSVSKDGTVITSRLSEPGDGGAVVITEDGKLVGILMSSSQDSSYVTPVAEALEELNLALLKPKPENP